MNRWPELKIRTTFYDPSARQLMLELDNVGIACNPAINNVALGIERVRSALQMRDDGKPGLIVHPRCTNTAREFTTYEYATYGVGKSQNEAPLKVDDHAMDSLRYGITTSQW